MIGPGSYDDLCTLVRKRAKARSVIVIVIGGERGNGFSCQTDTVTLLALPNLLRTMADEIEEKGIGA